MDLIIPPEFAPKAYGAIKNMSTILEEGWMSDGSWHGVVELPAGLRLSFLDTINKIVRGSIQVKILK
jgi:ribosome maturation protein SDO1